MLFRSAYRVEIEKQLGMNLPPQSDEAGEDIHMDPQVEARLAPLLAQAAQRLLQQNQAQAQQQQAQQQAQDPIIQLQQQELQLKQQELQRKSQKDQADEQFRAKQQQIERERIQSQTQATLKGQQIKAAEKAASLMVQKQLNQEDFKHDAMETLAEHDIRDRQQKRQLYADGLKTHLNAKLQEKKGNE